MKQDSSSHWEPKIALSQIQALLLAAKVLEENGRSGSAATLRRTYLPERIMLATGRRASASDASRASSRSVRAAVILDEFSANSFDGSFDGVHLHPEHWREQFEAHRPEVFLCESAWSGRDSKLRPWKGKIYASKNFSRENRVILLEILEHCRANNIPTVFWNKEDPTHYIDRVHDFVKTAANFDHVFTTAEECVDAYKTEYGLKSVHALPFATNPSLFSPIETAPRSNAVVFAGSWYANHIERSEAMGAILRGLRDSGYQLDIYDRYFGDSDVLHHWPEEFAPFLLPAVPHDQIAGVYKRSRFGLNINTVTASRTMFARRVFELMSSNTLVLSNYSVGIDEMFGRDVIFVDRDPDRMAQMSPAEVNTTRERNLNLVLSKHTYRQRWEQILTTVGVPFRPAAEALTVVWPARSLADAEAGVIWFQHEANLNRDRLLLLAVDDMPPLEIAALYENFNRFGITVTSLRHAEGLAIDEHYAPVETSHIAMILPNDIPPGGWLGRARLHLQYSDNPIVAARPNEDRYVLAPWQTKRSQIVKSVPIGATNKLWEDNLALVL